MAYVLAFTQANPFYYVPNNGKTLMNLNGAVDDGYGNTLNITNAILDDNIDFGSDILETIEEKAYRKNGATFSSKTYKDRIIKFTVFMQSTNSTSTSVRAGLRQLQQIVTDAFNFQVSNIMGYGEGQTSGLPVYLKYQPDSNVAAIYFQVKKGLIDNSGLQNQVQFLQNSIEIPVELTCSYAGYGDA